MLSLQQTSFELVFFFIDFVLFVSKLLFLDLICEFITFCIDFVLFIFEFLFLELIFEFILQPFNLSVTWELGCFLCIIQACRVDVMWSRLIIKELSLGKKQTDISPALQPYDIIITITSLGKASLLKLKIFCQIFQTIMITILSFTLVLGKWLLKISMFFSSVFSSCLNFQSFSHGWICSTFLKKNKRTWN